VLFRDFSLFVPRAAQVDSTRADSGLIFGGRGKLAIASISLDDNVPDLGRRACQLAAIAKTLEWRQ
jgi:hypothetical protein